MVAARYLRDGKVCILALPGDRPPHTIRIPVMPPLATRPSRAPVSKSSIGVLEFRLAGPSLTGEPNLFDYL